MAPLEAYSDCEKQVFETCARTGLTDEATAASGTLAVAIWQQLGLVGRNRKPRTAPRRVDHLRRRHSWVRLGLCPRVDNSSRRLVWNRGTSLGYLRQRISPRRHIKRVAGDDFHRIGRSPAALPGDYAVQPQFHQYPVHVLRFSSHAPEGQACGGVAHSFWTHPRNAWQNDPGHVLRRPRSSHQFVQERAERHDIGVLCSLPRGVFRGTQHRVQRSNWDTIRPAVFMRRHLPIPLAQSRSHAGGITQRRGQRQTTPVYRRGKALTADRLFGP